MRPEQLMNRRRRPRLLAVAGTALALVAGVSMAAVSASAATGTGQGRPHAVVLATGNLASPGTAAAARSQAPQTTTVTLLTGDQVRLSTAGGSQQATPIPAGSVHGVPRSAATFIKFSLDGDQYVVPDAAVPYLGSTLDPRLFDVSYLARAHLGTPGSAGIPVRVTYAGAARMASLPGLHVIRHSGATVSGTITTSGARLLGQLLTARSHGARRRHAAVPATGLPGIRKISLAPPAGAPALPPSSAQRPASDAVPYYTLTLKATDLNGNPGTFAGIIQNVNDPALFTQRTALTNSAGTGTASVSVPKGTYSLAISVVTPDRSGAGFVTALVVKPQITVDGNTTVRLDARTAVPFTAKLSTTVSAAVRADDLNYWRSAQGGGAVGVNGTDNAYGIFGMGLYSASPNAFPKYWADSLRVTPAAPVSDGSFLFDAQTMLSNSNAQGPGSMYLFDFPHRDVIPSSLSYTVPAASLTTVRNDLYQSPLPGDCTPTAVNTNVFMPVGDGAWTENEFEPAAAAGERTDYWYSSDPRLDLWQYTAIYSGGCSGFPGIFGFNGPIWSIHPGQRITATWNKAPLAPSSLAPPFWADQFESPGASTVRGFLDPNLGDPRALTVCTACRQGDIGTLNILPYGSGSAEYGKDFDAAENSSFLFYRNGTLAIDASPQAQPLGVELPLLHQRATYRLDWTEAQQTEDAPAGASIDTDWTFRSGPADAPARLPATETCAPDATRRCSFLPLLFPSYNLPLNDNNQATAGTPEPVSFTVTGQQNAPLPPGLSATVSASFDGGKTWTAAQAATSLGGGRFTVTIAQPALSATNRFVSLRVTAHDASGDSVTQTITDAYGLTS
jgi:hypothetical protein